MLFTLLLLAAATAGGRLAGALAARLTAGAALPWRVAAGMAAAVGAALLVGRLAWPSYLAPVYALGWLLGSLAGTVRGALRPRPGRHA